MSSEDVPTGILTFLFRGLVDSTYLWEQRGADMEISVAGDDALLDRVVGRNTGTVVSSRATG